MLSLFAIFSYFLTCAIFTFAIYHHHHIALVARISLTLSRHSSLSFIALGRSSGQHPVSSPCHYYLNSLVPKWPRSYWLTHVLIGSYGLILNHVCSYRKVYFTKTPVETFAEHFYLTLNVTINFKHLLLKMTHIVHQSLNWERRLFSNSPGNNFPSYKIAVFKPKKNK